MSESAGAIPVLYAIAVTCGIVGWPLGAWGEANLVDWAEVVGGVLVFVAVLTFAAGVIWTMWKWAL